MIKQWSIAGWMIDFTMNEDYISDGRWIVPIKDFIKIAHDSSQDISNVSEFENKRKLIIV